MKTLPRIGGQYFAARLGALLLSSLIMPLLPAPAQAACSQWDVSGTWDGVNGPANKNGMHFDLIQKGTQLEGMARTFESATRLKVTGGTMIGNVFTLTVQFTDTMSFTYHGTVDSNGRLSGAARETGPWVSSRAMKCADAVTAQPPQAEQGMAGISANPRVLRNGGTTTITWNAGGGHPNAEVWVRVNDHDEKMLFTGQKGTQSVTVKPDKKYLYMLRDAGQQLGTVTVKTKDK